MTTHRPQQQSTTYPFLFSLLLTLLLLVFPILSGTIATILELGELEGRLIQSLAFLLAALLGCVLGMRYFGSLESVGLRKPAGFISKDLLWFTPLLYIEVLPLFFGLKQGLTFTSLAIYLVFTLLVGFTEELYFRGLIWNILNRKSMISALFLSSLLFSLGHFVNLLAGASFMDTMLQVIFAFIFGVVAVEISFATKSLLIPIVWHTVHNFISLITVPNQGKLSLSVALLQGTVLFLYGAYLYFTSYRQTEEKKI